jgi:dnd system-associated protein 4
MAITRVSVAEDKAALVRSLRSSEASTGPFKTYADVVTFAAVLGLRNSRKVPITGFSRREPDRIPQDQFRSPFIIEPIAVADVQDPKIQQFAQQSGTIARVVSLFTRQLAKCVEKQWMLDLRYMRNLEGAW